MLDFYIKQFKIKGLFWDRDVTIEFNNPVNIFLGENGMGKTTILNIIRCVFDQQFRELIDMPFDELSLVTQDNFECHVRRIDIEAYFNNRRRAFPREINIEEYLSNEEIVYLRDLLKHDSNVVSGLFEKTLYRVANESGYPLHIIRRLLKEGILSSEKSKGNPKIFIEFRSFAREMFGNFDILYFPTYRRIEEDINKLGLNFNDEEDKEKMIQFGTKDVESSIQTTLDNIRNNTIASFTSMTGVLIEQYLSCDSIQTTSTSFDSKKLQIVFDRIGDKISANNKKQIKKRIATKEIYDENNQYLFNLLNHLVNSYDEQSQYDQRIKEFVDVCNKYLIGKKYSFDENKIELNLIKDGNQIIPLQCLSSGEKQIISLFSKLYLNEDKKYIILFDEPELSLSIFWQKELLPDIMKTNGCSMLVAVTHSPFIFDNDFACYANDMNNCIKKEK